MLDHKLVVDSGSSVPVCALEGSGTSVCSVQGAPCTVCDPSPAGCSVGAPSCSRAPCLRTSPPPALHLRTPSPPCPPAGLSAPAIPTPLRTAVTIIQTACLPVDASDWNVTALLATLYGSANSTWQARASPPPVFQLCSPWHAGHGRRQSQPLLAVTLSTAGPDPSRALHSGQASGQALSAVYL